MPPALKKDNWIPLAALVLSIVTSVCSVIYASGVRDAATKVEIEQIKKDIAVTKSDHDLFVEVKTKVDEMVKRLERIEAKIDAR